MSTCTAAQPHTGVQFEPQPLAYDIPTASRVSTISRSQLYVLISQGKIQSTTIGRRRVIIAASLHRLIAEGC